MNHRNQTNRFKRLISLCLLLLAISSGNRARAGYIHEWTFHELAQKSDVLATAQVISVTTLGPDEKASPGYPQLKRRATVRVLRAVASRGQAVPAAGQELTVEFKSFDYARIHVFINTMPGEMPDLAPGEICVFPLRRPAQDAQARAGGEWRILEGSGINLLTPALVQEPPKPAPSPGTSAGFDFLRWELAGVFAHGNDEQILQATERYYFAYWVGGSPLLNSFDLIEQNVHDEERWLSVAASGLIASAQSTPRVPLRKLLSRPIQSSKWSEGERLEARILAHVSKENIEARLAQAVLRISVTPDGKQNSGASVLLLSDLADQPQVRPAFEAGLKREDQGWIYATNWMSDKHNPLADVALAWAMQHLSDKVLSQPWNYCPIIRRWGSPRDIEALAARIERARLSNATAYKSLLNASTSEDWSGRGQRQKPLPPSVWSHVLDDTSEYQADAPGWRWCDQAAVEIGRAANLGFSIRRGSQLTKRDQAVAKARAWRPGRRAHLKAALGTS